MNASRKKIYNTDADIFYVDDIDDIAQTNKIKWDLITE